MQKISLKHILIKGGYHYVGNGNYYDDILEYDPKEDTILSVGTMIQTTRAYHVVSVVQVQNYSMWCQ